MRDVLCGAEERGRPVIRWRGGDRIGDPGKAPRSRRTGDPLSGDRALKSRGRPRLCKPGSGLGGFARRGTRLGVPGRVACVAGRGSARRLWVRVGSGRHRQARGSTVWTRRRRHPGSGCGGRACVLRVGYEGEDSDRRPRRHYPPDSHPILQIAREADPAPELLASTYPPYLGGFRKVQDSWGAGSAGRLEAGVRVTAGGAARTSAAPTR